MRARIVLGYFAMMFLLVLPAHADGKAQLQKYFSDAASKVKATAVASEKRAILNESFQNMSDALNMVQRLPFITQDDGIAIAHFQSVLQEKQDELAGNNGFVRVSDQQLNAFSNYVVQDMEQAAEVISISLVALLLIIVIVVLLV